MIFDTSIPAEVIRFAQETKYRKVRAIITTQTDSRTAIKTYEYLKETTADGVEVWEKIDGFSNEVNDIAP